jgi:hypothetical protein
MRKFWLKLILAMMKDDFDINGFLLMKIVYCRWFFVWNSIFEPKVFLVLGWLWVLKSIFGLLKYMNIFYKVFKVFFGVEIWLKISFSWSKIA